MLISNTLILLAVICCVNQAVAGPRLTDYTSYKEFGGEHQAFAREMFKEKPGHYERHKFEMVYPEKEKKAMRLECLGVNYIKGDLFFLEFPTKDNGVYVSFNSDGYLDAVLIEVNKSIQGAVMFTWNEIVASLLAMRILPSSKVNQNDFMEVITGERPYIDMHCFNQNNESFYLRIKDAHISSRPFYRVVLYRL